ncbi:MAG TPA: trypsin-like peptidase domain-containing protein [Gammaproteobacteria bacterium]|jgi:S1-C subfamily serine protease|nr:trypsin-like peptidase domain-containing protein [Gammaproteobacteria bacterium]
MKRLLVPVLFLAGLLGLLDAQAASTEQVWAQTLARVSPSVVSIRVDAPRAFDTEWNLTGQATGFVVDAEHGIILTNRHVVTPGPVVAEAVFQDHEVVTLKQLYHDPIHDFGLYQYDPAALKYIHPVSLKLAPHDARVGEDIRIIGNDAGEQLSILSGTLARLDRDAPVYGAGGYNDFNTFYFQAVSGTTGGSSGSPVINIDGDVIALNAGARNDAASSYFLPLDRVVRALGLVLAGQPVARGTLQTVFQHEYYDELERLGLSADTEAQLRKQHPDATGLLVVDQVIPGGPADNLLQPGDVLLSVDGAGISTFVPLDEKIDDSVGKTLAVDVLRAGTPRTLQIKVQDLASLSPVSYLEFGGATLNDLSLQVARGYNVPTHGVYIANPGYVFGTAGIQRAAVITEFNGSPVDDLDDLQRAVQSLPDGSQVRLHYFNLANHKQSALGIITVDRRWFPADRCGLDPQTGNWPCTALAEPTAAAPLPPVTVSYPHYNDPAMDSLAPSLVFIKFDMPYAVDGVGETHYLGAGVVVDAKKGLVVTDRDTVPVSMGDVKITFAGSVEIPGKVVYVHPLHNLAVIQYDPKLLGTTPVKGITFAKRLSRPGDSVKLVGYQADGTLTSLETRISSQDPVLFPLSRTFRFRDTNLEALSLVNAPENVTGVLLDKQNQVSALWVSFAYDDGNRTQEVQKAIPADVVEDMVNAVEQGTTLRSLDVDLFPIALSQARRLGLPDDWAAKLGAVDPARREALAVVRTTAGTPAEKLLHSGDLLLAVDGKPVADYRAVEKASQQPEVKLTVLRDGQVTDVDAGTVSLDGDGTERALMWAGALLQEPQHAAAAQRAVPRTGLLIGYYNFGSPASRYGLTAGLRIVKVNDQLTPDMDSFEAAVRGFKDRDNVRLTVQNWDGTSQVVTLKLDLRYWPSYEVVHTAEGWVRKPL